MPKVRLLYFALLRERLGVATEPLELATGATLFDLQRLIAARHPLIDEMGSAIRWAVNGDFADAGRVLADHDEIALIPPVSGGSGLFRVTDRPLALDEVVDAVRFSGHGGIVTFTGTVRDHSRGRRVLRLEYEAYAPMAERQMALIAEEIATESPGVRLAIMHRVGRLEVGEAAVVVAASAPHRREAFAACERAIDRLKERVPIWKKEVAEDGEVWIGLGP